MSPEQIEQAQTMRRNEMPWAHIAKHFGVTPDTVRRVLDPEWAARRRAGITDGERLLREVPADTRDLTARALGDPLPGRSALDRMRNRENA